MRFQDIIGQEATKAKLISAVVNQHLAHALLFTGNEGSANMAMALALATYINCENRSEQDACGRCSACIKSAKLVHPDINFAAPVSGSKNGRPLTTRDFINEWRAFLPQNIYGNQVDWATAFANENKNLNIPREEITQIIQNLSLKSFEGGAKIQIIWLAEFMKAPAANALLKILEEPPANTFFFLVTNQEDSLLATILSRTQRIYIASPTDEEIAAYLTKHELCSADKLADVVQLANGNLRKAIQLCDEIGDDQFSFFVSWMRECFGFKINELSDKAEQFNAMGKVGQQNFLTFCMNMFRESLIKMANADNLQRLNEEQKSFMEKFSKTLNLDRVAIICRLLEEAIYHVNRNVHAKLLFVDLSFKIGSAFRK